MPARRLDVDDRSPESGPEARNMSPETWLNWLGPGCRGPKHQPPRLAEVRRLLEDIRDDRLQAAVYLALGMSLRRTEVPGRHWEDVDLDERTLTARGRVNRVGQGVGLIVRHGARSESGERVAILPQLVGHALRAHRSPSG
jgi:integrase